MGVAVDADVDVDVDVDADVVGSDPEGGVQEAAPSPWPSTGL